MFTLPNILTLLNLVAGCAGIVSVFTGQVEWGAFWIWIAVFFDYADGMAARLMRKFSDLGKDLDSLADMVSFGVLPGAIMFRMMQNTEMPEVYAYSAFIITAFSALRLAKFNNDERQSDTFFGLPTPANALFISSLPYLGFPFLSEYWVLLAITVVFSVLLVSEIRMFALKFKTLSFGKNRWKYLAIVTAVILVSIFMVKAIPFVILGYILISLLINLLDKSS